MAILDNFVVILLMYANLQYSVVTEECLQLWGNFAESLVKSLDGDATLLDQV